MSVSSPCGVYGSGFEQTIDEFASVGLSGLELDGDDVAEGLLQQLDGD